MTQHTPTAADAEQADDHASWTDFRRRRDESLAARHGILSQVALHWIDPSAGPQHLGEVPGSWEISEDRPVVRFRGTELTLLADSSEVDVHADDGDTVTTVTATGDVRLASFGEDVQIDVIHRGGRIGLRLLDPAAPRLATFDGVPTFPYDPGLIHTGTFRPQPTTVRVGSALPWLEQDLPSPGIATLEIAGAEVDLVLTGESSILFTDETSGSESTHWRQVSAQLEGDRVHVDLNFSLNFPSAFSVWGTCPRPPAGNHLPLAVRAGEAPVEPTER